ncbi:hypothetical protein [Paenibacillus sp. P22]|uniref:hypothetical protein n=1 Tax=Paenibacillus sp. P22 TaxID=483908 RepID=UPI00038F7569|nr:hypothetical protein [Paenibacillus sp. P22]CDN42086.1 hypothetical protein BN871_AT_00880 [Paenibacillus sp. P22]
MAKYEAHPLYGVVSGAVDVKFDHAGAYETEDAAEIAVLDALCPLWAARVDEPQPEDEGEQPAKKAPAPRKPSAK